MHVIIFAPMVWNWRLDWCLNFLLYSRFLFFFKAIGGRKWPCHQECPSKMDGEVGSRQTNLVVVKCVHEGERNVITSDWCNSSDTSLNDLRWTSVFVWMWPWMKLCTASILRLLCVCGLLIFSSRLGCLLILCLTHLSS